MYSFLSIKSCFRSFRKGGRNLSGSWRISFSDSTKKTGLSLLQSKHTFSWSSYLTYPNSIGFFFISTYFVWILFFFILSFLWSSVWFLLQSQFYFLQFYSTLSISVYFFFSFYWFKTNGPLSYSKKFWYAKVFLLPLVKLSF